jgi:hypothetical protein
MNLMHANESFTIIHRTQAWHAICSNHVSSQLARQHHFLILSVIPRATRRAERRLLFSTEEKVRIVAQSCATEGSVWRLAFCYRTKGGTGC